MKFFFTIFIAIIILSCSDDIDSPYQDRSPEILKIDQIVITPKYVDRTPQIEIQFNKKIVYSTIYKSISCWSESKNISLKFKMKYGSTYDTIIITPRYLLLPFVKYSCKITKDISDIYRNKLDKEYTFSFKTSINYFTNYQYPKIDFETVYDMVQNRCVLCHDNGDNLNLNRERKDLYKYLIKEKNIETNRFYIYPKNEKKSYLINKLTGYKHRGSIMPLNSDFPLYELEKFIGWVYYGGDL